MGEGELLGGRYRLVRRLGAGGMAEVWRGKDEVLDRSVAAKMAASGQASDRALRRRIRLEAKAAARLSHPHVTSVYDYGEALGPTGQRIPFVVMELVDGATMAERLAEDGALPWPVAVRACAQVAAALAAAHAHGVVHRDIKPGNVMLTPAGAKVLDFGISALVGDPDVDEDCALLGTPAYLAPERLGGAAVTAGCDVYAIGLLLHHCLTGGMPWSADTPTEMLKEHLRVDPDPLPPLDGLPPQVAAVCQRCLAKDPADRPTSEHVAQELASTVGAAANLAPVSLSAIVDSQVPRWSAGGDTDAPTCRKTMRRPLIPGRPRAAGRLHRPATKTGLLASAALLCAGAVTGAVAWPASTDKTHNAPAEAAVGSGAAPGSCSVQYEVTHMSGITVTADVTVTNTGAQPFPNWHLSFDLPGKQQLRQGTNASWRQNGTTVTARSAEAALPPAASVGLTVTASYQAGTPLPVAYNLNSVPCSAIVLGPPPPTRPSTPQTQAAAASARGARSAGAGDSEHGNNKHDKGKGNGKGKGKDDRKGKG